MREQLQSILETINTEILYDPASVNWNDFEFRDVPTKHIIKDYEVKKPYYISYQYFNDTVYTDIIMLINKVDNIFDLKAGSILYIPSLTDLTDFVLKQKTLNG
jgi:Skp family chaperone for outer membrane proteins